MSRSPAPAALVLITCLVASVSYIGAITQGALVTLLLPAVAVVGLVAALLRERPLTAFVVTLALTAMAAEVVNVVSGDYEGPVARSTAVAALATGLAVALSAMRCFIMFLLPLTALVTWSLALGAGGHVQLIAIITTALALISFARAEHEQRAFAAPPRRVGSAVFAFFLVVATGVFATFLQKNHDWRPAASPFRQTLERTITPPSFLSMAAQHARPLDSAPLQPTAARPSVPAADDAEDAKVQRLVSMALWFSLGLTVAMLAAGISRLLWAAWAWHRLYVRLVRATTGTEAGAWLWMLAHLSRAGMELPPQSSPDRVAAGELDGLNAELRIPVQQVAASVSQAVFAAPGTNLREDIWPAARAVADAAWASASRLGRLHARWRMPRRVAVMATRTAQRGCSSVFVKVAHDPGSG